MRFERRLCPLRRNESRATGGGRSAAIARGALCHTFRVRRSGEKSGGKKCPGSLFVGGRRHPLGCRSRSERRIEGQVGIMRTLAGIRFALIIAALAVSRLS